jgi:hypothetical protein
MIGRYLDVLTEAQEDRVLTGKMVPGQYARSDGTRCLVGCAGGAHEISEPCGVTCTEWLDDLAQFNAVSVAGSWFGVEHRYDRCCSRFGVQRTNDLIRNRILRNRTRRALLGVRMDAADPLCMELSR